MKNISEILNKYIVEGSFITSKDALKEISDILQEDDRIEILNSNTIYNNGFLKFNFKTKDNSYEFEIKGKKL